MEQGRQDLFRYVVEEFAEDYREGEIQRREFLRRMLLLGGGIVGANVLIDSLGLNAVSAAEWKAVSETTATLEQAQTQGQVSPDDPAISVKKLTYNARGFDQFAYFARPAGDASVPGVIVIHENRGLQPHIQDVARRFAKAGYAALAPDLVSKGGGTDKFADTAQISTLLAQTGGDEHVANLLEAVKTLRAQTGVQGMRIGATGYCFGGGLTWRLSTEMSDLRAAVPFYGPAPDLAKVPNIKAAVLGIYGGNDARINAGIPALEEALKKAGTKYQIKIYDGANHAFHNDTGANYKKDAAEDAWKMTLEWFKANL
jgi:carboxymethylenebutenolidase